MIETHATLLPETEDSERGLLSKLLYTLEGQFSVNYSAASLSVRIGAGTLQWADGTHSAVAAGTVTLQPSTTNFVVVELWNLGLRVLRRAIHTGCVVVAEITTDADGVTAVKRPRDYVVPPTCIPRVKARLAAGLPVRVALIGDSITYGSGSGTMWTELLFQSAYSANGFNVTNVSNVTRSNYGVGGQLAQHGLAVVGRACSSAVNSAFRVVGMGYHYGQGVAERAASWADASRESDVLLQQPDLAIVGYAQNGGDYEAQAVEAIVAKLRRRGIEVILHTENANDTDPDANAADGVLWGKIATAHGCELADTWAYVDEVNANGTDTYYDTVHQTQDGWDEYAAAVRSCLNDRAQAACVVPPVKPGIVGASETPTGYRIEHTDFVWESCNTTGSYGASGTGTKSIPSIYGRALTSALLSVDAGEYADFCHSAFLAADLLIETGYGSDFEADIQVITASGTTQTIGTLSYTDSTGSNHTATRQVFSVTNAITDLLTAWYYSNQKPAGAASAAIRISVTSGTANILGMMFHGYETRELGYEWTTRTNADDIEAPIYEEAVNAQMGPHRYTDTDLNYFEIPFEGRGLQLYFDTSTGGGKVDIYVDGILHTSQLNTYAATGTYVKIVNVFPAVSVASGDYTRGEGRHVCLVRLNGRDAASDAVTSSKKRRLAIVRATVLAPL